MTKNMEFSDRLALIERGPDECWLWEWAKTPRGYGHFRRNKRDEYAHRAAYELRVGPIPPLHDLDHTCENTSCANPRHLQPVLRKEHAVRTWSRTTHCRHGHERSVHGWKVFPNGDRLCQQCYVDWYLAKSRRISLANKTLARENEAK